MDTLSCSDDDLNFNYSDDDINFNYEKLHEAPPARTALPYQSLLGKLHTLTMSRDCDRSAIWLTSGIRRQIQTVERELRFQQMIFMLLQNRGSLVEPIKETAAHLEDDLDSQGLFSYLGQDEWEYVFSRFLENLDWKIKSHLKKFCLGIVDWLLNDNSSRECDIYEFIDIIFLKLKDLKISRPNMIVSEKKQMKTLEEILHVVWIIAKKRIFFDEKLQTFLVYFRPWVNIAAALVILYWVDEKDEVLFAMISLSLEKCNLSFLELAKAYILVIKTLKPSNLSAILMMRETVGNFTDMVLENLIVSTDDRFEMFREGLTLWIALLMDPPQGDAEDEKLICAQTNLLVDKAQSLIRSLCLNKLGEDIAERRDILLNDFLEKMNEAKSEIRQLHVKIPGLSWNNVPQTNGRGFFDFLLENLQKKLESEADMFRFEKHLIAIVHKELLLLRPFLMDIFGLQNEHMELRDIWVQASYVAYLVDYVTDSCLSSTDIPIWCNLMHLSTAIEKIQSVQTEVSKFRENDQIYKNRVVSAKVNTKVVLPRQKQANATTKDDVKVGFADEEQRIIDWLTAGKVRLDIAAIVGMAGQGKTTLAQRVFQDSRVEHHFHMYAWCCISQTYDIKEILLDILRNVGDPVSEKQVPSVSQEDLADRLRKCLKGRRYLVVLDDVWDAKAWYELQLSFPDDNNGSRILLTSQIEKVPRDVKADSCIVQLYPLPFEESSKLLRMKVFDEDWWPSTLSDIGNMIAENCQGLPLAIVVVAGLLKKHKNVDSWKQILESLKSQLKGEGCLSILELSYNHLPDYLKPCFLYLGAFKEDQMIDAKRLIQFWIAEGFIQNDGMKSKGAVANEYLTDLVSRSLVFVAQRSSGNEIRKCFLHDLLHELCLIKAKEERFLLVSNVCGHPSSIRYDHYRLCVHGEWEPFADSEFPSVRSLLIFHGGPCHNLRSFKLLRVLDLSYASVRPTDFDEITQFIHLRFLSVACDFPIPSSIVNLFKLEVLRLQFYNFTRPRLPCDVMKMANLRHIFASGCSIECTEEFDELRHSNLESFTSLEFSIFEDSSFERVAQKLPNILKLGLELSFCVHLSSYFKKLESLNLYIHQPIQGVISHSTLDFPLTLKKLKFRASNPISGALMSSIGKLSNLEVLKLHADFEDERWDVEDDEFLKLKYLEISVSSFQEWNVSDESFPCLVQLVVDYCKKLGELPGRFGAITTLKSIEVSDCSESVSNSFQQIVDDQMDYGNEDLQFSIS